MYILVYSPFCCGVHYFVNNIAVHLQCFTMFHGIFSLYKFVQVFSDCEYVAAISGELFQLAVNHRVRKQPPSSIKVHFGRKTFSSEVYGVLVEGYYITAI